MIDEIALKLREENLYPKDILSVVSSIKPSEQFIGFVNKVFAQFCRKHNQDALLTTFYGDMVKEWKSFFPPCQDQKAINLLLIHFPQKLVGHYKLGSIQDMANFQVRLNHIYNICTVTKTAIYTLYFIAHFIVYPLTSKLWFYTCNLSAETVKLDGYSLISYYKES